jgi:hypothetical protein
MTVNLLTHKTNGSNQFTGTTLSESAQTHINQLKDLVTKRRKIRVDVIKFLREIYQTNVDQRNLFGSYKDKAHRYFAEKSWLKETYLGSDPTLLKILQEIQKNSSC